MKVRIKFSKTGPIRFTGHLDVMRYFQKAMRRAHVPIAYSEGFNPHQIMSFASPLSVGYTSQGEYLDIQVTSFSGAEDLKNSLQAVMAEGIQILQVQLLPEGAGNAMASVAAAAWLVTFRPDTVLPDGWQEKLKAFCSQECIPVVKKTKKGEKELNLKESIYELKVITENFQGIFMLLNASSGGNIKPAFVLECFFETLGYQLPPYALMIHRQELYQCVEGRLVPLIWEK